MIDFTEVKFSKIFVTTCIISDFRAGVKSSESMTINLRDTNMHRYPNNIGFHIYTWGFVYQKAQLNLYQVNSMIIKIVIVIKDIVDYICTKLREAITRPTESTKPNTADWCHPFDSPCTLIHWIVGKFPLLIAKLAFHIKYYISSQSVSIAIDGITYHSISLNLAVYMLGAYMLCVHVYIC